MAPTGRPRPSTHGRSVSLTRWRRPRVAELLERYALECHHTDQIDEALASERHALEHFRALGDVLREGDALTWISVFAYLAADWEESRAAAQQAVAVLERLPPGRELARAYSNMAKQAQGEIDVAETLMWGERALELANELGDDDTFISTLQTMGRDGCNCGTGHGEDRAEPRLGARSRNGRPGRPRLRQPRLRSRPAPQMGGGRTLARRGPSLCDRSRPRPLEDVPTRLARRGCTGPGSMG